jgi:hypothetical protein
MGRMREKKRWRKEEKWREKRKKKRSAPPRSYYASTIVYHITTFICII